MTSLVSLPDELLSQIVTYLGFSDAVRLKSTSKTMNELVSAQIDTIQEKEESERQWQLLKDKHNKSGFRNVASSVDNDAFEKGVKDGYVTFCNSSFIDGQWKGYQFANMLFNNGDS
eukprot:120048_1